MNENNEKVQPQPSEGPDFLRLTVIIGIIGFGRLAESWPKSKK